MKNLKDSLNKGIILAQANAVCAAKKAKDKLEKKDGSITDYALQIVIGIVAAAILVAGIVLLLKNKILPQANTKVDDFFNLAG